MSLDPSLKTAASLAKHRNVLTRAERVARLTRQERFDPKTDTPLGLPKVGNRKVIAGKKAKAKKEE